MTTTTRETEVLATCSNRSKAAAVQTKFEQAGRSTWITRVAASTYEVRSYLVTPPAPAPAPAPRKPRAARRPDRCNVGTRIHAGQIINGALATIDGVVLYSEYATLSVCGGKLRGEINIVKRPYGEFGMDYAVTVNGQMIFAAGHATWFRTLTAAAEFIGA